MDLSNADLTKVGERDIVVDQFIYHEVPAKETLYSITKKFDISAEELMRHNPLLRQEELKIGQVLKIPVPIKEEAVLVKEKNTQPYLVKPKETKYSIARQFGISIAYLEELNPNIAVNGLQIDDVILVPKSSVEVADAEYVIHQVEKGQTIYSLTNQYGISQEQLLAANPELSDGVQEGMSLRIPNSARISKGLFEDRIDRDRQIKLAMLLPFRTRRDSLDFQKDRLLSVTSDFYFGALLAIDSLKAQGMSVHLKVYDTENSTEVTERISKGAEFQDFDALIGPMFLENVEVVSRNTKNGQALIVSPISTKDHSAIGNRNLVQDRASMDQHIGEMLEFARENYQNQNLVIIRNASKKSDELYERIHAEIQALNPDKKVKVLKPKDGYIKPEVFKVFRDTLERDIVNWFFITDDEPAFLGDVFNNLGVFPAQDSLVVFGFEKSRNYNKIDNNFLNRVHFHYPSNSYLDLESTAYKSFEKMYRRKYFGLPSEYSVEGFDATYDLLMRLSTDPDLIGQGLSERLSTRYDYIENTSGSIVNKGLYIVRYEGLNLQVVNGLD